MIQKLVTDNGVSYEVKAMINEGTQGVIYKVVRREKSYAAKVFKSITPQLWNNITLMATEGAPNLSEKASFVWPIHTFSLPNKGYIMELLDSNRYKSVHELVDIKELSIVERLRIGLNLLKAIQALHSQKGLFFGDISAANVLIDVEDFSIKVVDTDGITNRPVDVIGTPGYMSRDVLLHHKPSFEADIFAAYVLLHEIIFNHHPYFGAFARKYKIYEEGLNQAILQNAGYIFASNKNALFEEGRTYAIWKYFLSEKAQQLMLILFIDLPSMEETIQALEELIVESKTCKCGEFTITHTCSVCFEEVN